MTKVTNIYIDTTGFTDEQYGLADEAMNGLKCSNLRGWSAGDASPNFKKYPVLCLDCDGDRQYLNNICELAEEFETRDCKPISFRELMILGENIFRKPVEAEEPTSTNQECTQRLYDELSFEIHGSIAKVNGQRVSLGDSMKPEKERAIVNGVMDALLSSRLISKMAHSVVTGAMDGYCAASDNQP